jgi:glycosyltransferase involved in cell wall biosynthesis
MDEEHRPRVTASAPRPIRVARVIARTNVGGPSLQITALMRGLDAERFPQDLFRGVVDPGEADYLELRAPDVRSTVVPGLGRSVKPLDDVRAFVFLVRELRRLRPTIVHTHTAKGGVLGRLAAVVTRVPIRVHTFHGHLLRGYFSPTVTRAVVAVERGLRPVTTWGVAVGDEVRQDLMDARILASGNSSVVAPGVVDPGEVNRAAARRTLGLADDARVVSFVGRLTTIKRTERFVALARELQDEVADALFVIIGDGPHREGLEASAADLTNLRFLGWQSDMSQVYAASDLVVLTSDNEGMPVALIEAAMQGVPAVSTDVGAVRQVVDDGTSGMLTAVGDAEALREATRSLLDDDERRRRMGEAARERARRLFGEQRLVADYQALYERLAAADETTRSSLLTRFRRRA